MEQHGQLQSQCGDRAFQRGGLNTLRYTGGTATLDLAGNDFATNGILNGGSGTLTVDNVTGFSISRLIIGGAETDIGGKSGVTVNVPIDWASNGTALVLYSNSSVNLSGGITTSSSSTGGGTIVFNGSGTTTISGTSPETGTGISGGLALVFNGSGSTTISSSIALTGPMSIVGNGAGSVTIGTGMPSSPSVFDINGSPRTVTIDKTGGTTSFSGVVFVDTSGNAKTLSFAGAGNVTFNNLGNSGVGAPLNLAGSGVYTFQGTSNASNNITLSSGTMVLNSSTLIGTNGTVTLAGGTFQAVNVSFANPLAFVGPGTITLDNTGGINSSYPLSSSGNETMSGSPTINWLRPGDSALTFSSVVKLQSDVTFTGSGNIRLSGGLDVQGGDRTMTENSANLVQSLYLVGKLGNTTDNVVHTLTLAGSGRGDNNGANLVGALGDLPGATPVVIQVNSTTGGIWNFGALLHGFGGAKHIFRRHDSHQRHPDPRNKPNGDERAARQRADRDRNFYGPRWDHFRYSNVEQRGQFQWKHPNWNGGRHQRVDFDIQSDSSEQPSHGSTGRGDGAERLGQSDEYYRAASRKFTRLGGERTRRSHSCQ